MEDKTIVGALVGCGLLGLISCCGFGFALYFVGSKSEDVANFPVDPDGPPPVVPNEPPPAMPGSRSPGGIGAENSVVFNLEVTSVSGSAPFGTGEQCRFSIEFDGLCHGILSCGDHHIYGGPTSGFFPCDWTVTPEAFHLGGGDGRTTSVDTDGAMSINTSLGHLGFRDDTASAFGEYRFEARITEASMGASRTL